jgi:AmmeMemoRadiSam system protein B
MKRLTMLVGIWAIESLVPMQLPAQTTRPIRDNVGFCWHAADMDTLVSFLAQNEPPGADSHRGVLIGGISPHDDYLYAARVYHPLFKRLRAKEIVIFGLTHGSVRKAVEGLPNVLVFDKFDLWQAPYGPVAISPLRDHLKGRLSPSDYLVSDEAHTLEHSIEALIPFCQYFNRETRITPILVGSMELPRMEEVSSRLAEILASYISERHLRPGEDIAFLISNDANHYGPDFDNSPFGIDGEAHRVATENDRRIAAMYVEGALDRDKMYGLAEEIRWDSASTRRRTLWCGRYPVVFGMLTVMKTMRILDQGIVNGRVYVYSDTWTEKVLPLRGTSMGLTAPFSLRHWVGFFSAGFVLEGK